MPYLRAQLCERHETLRAADRHLLAPARRRRARRAAAARVGPLGGRERFEKRQVEDEIERSLSMWMW